MVSFVVDSFDWYSSFLNVSHSSKDYCFVLSTDFSSLVGSTAGVELYASRREKTAEGKFRSEGSGPPRYYLDENVGRSFVAAGSRRFVDSPYGVEGQRQQQRILT